MKLTIYLPFQIVRRSILNEIRDEKKLLLKTIEQEKNSFQEAVRKASHNAVAGIVCNECKLNVYRADSTWVHSGKKAYCLECWQNRSTESE